MSFCGIKIVLILPLRTKRLIVDVIRAQPGESLAKILETPASELQVTKVFCVDLKIHHRRTE